MACKLSLGSSEEVSRGVRKFEMDWRCPSGSPDSPRKRGGVIAVKTPRLGHLMMFGLSRTKVVRNQDDIQSKVVDFYARKTAQGFWGCSGVHLTSQEGAQGAQVM